jgi:hypothetical protein
VRPEQKVQFAGQSVRAVPIQDRLGLDGSVTVHYISPEGAYLGSENKDQKLVVLPTDAVTLSNIWKGVDLTKPGAVEALAPANVAARLTPVSEAAPSSPDAPRR